MKSKESSSKGTVKRKPSEKKASASRRKPVASLVNQPAEAEIRKLANELYLSRIATGDEGSAESDWLIAEAILTSRTEDERAA